MDSYEQVTGDVFPGDGWRSAEFCGPNGGNCVEVNLGVSGVAGVRDSKSGGESVLAFEQSAWRGFLGATRSRGLDLG